MGADGHSPFERFANSVAATFDGPVTWFRSKWEDYVILIVFLRILFLYSQNLSLNRIRSIIHGTISNIVGCPLLTNASPMIMCVNLKLMISGEGISMCILKRGRG